MQEGLRGLTVLFLSYWLDGFGKWSGGEEKGLDSLPSKCSSLTMALKVEKSLQCLADLYKNF